MVFEFLSLLAHFLVLPAQVLAKLPDGGAGVFAGECHLGLYLGEFLLQLAQVNRGLGVDHRIVGAFFFQKFTGLFAFGQSQRQVLLFLVADHTHTHRPLFARAHRVREVAGVVHGLVVDLDDDVSRAQSGLLRAATLIDRAHQHSIAVLHAEEVAQLRRDVLYHQTAAFRPSRYDPVESRNIDLGNVDLGNVHMDIAHTVPIKLVMLVRQLHLDGHWLAIPAQAETHYAAGRHFVDHPPQLCATLDRRAIHGENNVVLLDAGFARRSVLVDHGYLNAFFLFQLQRAQPLRSHIRDVDPKIGTGAAVFAGVDHPGLRRRIDRQVLGCMRKGEEQGRQHDTGHNVFAHGHSLILNCLRLADPISDC